LHDFFLGGIRPIDDAGHAAFAHYRDSRA
jgi:hypothetical protein